MSFFELKPDNLTNWEWKAILAKEDDIKFNVINNLEVNNEIKLSDEDSINMYLVNYQRDKRQRVEKPYEADIIYWTDDISLNAFKPNASCCVIVSNRLRNILKEFHLPPHKFYPINLINVENAKEARPYNLLHIFGGIYANTDYLRSTYLYTDWETDEVIKEEYGVYNNLEAFQKAEKDTYENNKVQIKISKRVLSVNYDIVWGYANTLIINERVKNSAAEANLKGVKIKPFRDYEIICH